MTTERIGVVAFVSGYATSHPLILHHRSSLVLLGTAALAVSAIDAEHGLDSVSFLDVVVGEVVCREQRCAAASEA